MQNSKGEIAMRESTICTDQKWKQLPTDELDRILQAELEKKHPNEEVVLPIVRILEERERDYPVEKTPEVLALLGKLNKQVPSSPKVQNKGRWVTTIAAVAAAACIIVMALPRTVGAESIFDVLFRWTSEVFEFFTPERDKKNPPVEYLFETDNSGLQQLYDEVTKLGVTEPVVPMWLPKEFELRDLKVTPLRDDGYKVRSAFRYEEKLILITYRVSRDIVTRFEKEEADIEVFEFGGERHFIMDNGENPSVTWTVNGAECSIVAELNKDNLCNMIKSIYRRM